MKKLFEVTVQWYGEKDEEIIEERVEDAKSVIDDTHYAPEDFSYDDESFLITAIEEMEDKKYAKSA